MALKPCRECQQEVSVSAATCPHCGIPDPGGTKLKRGRCLGCGKEIEISPTESCPKCGVSNPLVPMRRSRNATKMRQSADLGPQALAAMGFSMVLFLGVFLPIVRLPFVGTQNYFQNGTGDGVLIILLVAIALGMVAVKSVSSVWIPGFLSLGVLAFTFFHLQSSIASAHAELRHELAGNPFRGVGEMALDAVQMEWGWAVLIIGGLGLTISGVWAHTSEIS